jgi:hypothetical protein
MCELQAKQTFDDDSLGLEAGDFFVDQQQQGWRYWRRTTRKMKPLLFLDFRFQL